MGAWVYHTYKHFSELTTANLTLIPAAIVIAVGAFLFIIGCLGCIAACKENKCLLAIVSVFHMCATVAAIFPASYFISGKVVPCGFQHFHHQL